MKKNILVLYGGTSKERKVSLKTGLNIYNAIDKKVFNKFLIDTKQENENFLNIIKKKKIHLVIIALHGRNGEDGTIQGFLETLGIKYLGSKVLSSAIAMNKEITKIILKANNILTPKWQIIKKNGLKSIKVKTPFVVKPVNEGSSFGVTIVRKNQELKRAINKAMAMDNEIIIEKYIEGRELTVPIIGNGKDIIILPVIEIIPPKEASFFDYKSKYSGQTQEIVPAKINNQLTQRIQKIAKETYQALKCKDIARIDMIMDKKNIVYVLEANTLPGMTSESLLPRSAKAFGLDFNKLISELIRIGAK